MLKIGLFLGAGASVQFNKPTTVQFKEKLINKFGSTKRHSFFESFLTCPDYEDIEHILQAIKEINQLFDNYGGKYFDWMGSDNAILFHMSPSAIGLATFKEEMKRIQNVIENQVFENYSWNHEEDKHLALIYNELFQFILKESNEIKVFTTNYDRAIEEYCSDPNNRITCIDGFQLDNASGRFIWAKGDFGYLGKREDRQDLYLYKLHGSLNWKRHSKYGIERTSEERKSNDPKYTENMLVYPTVSPKDGYEKEPYQSIRENFKNEMKKIDVCIVVGFSFRDEHVNEVFDEFIKDGKKIMSLSPSAIRDFRMNFLKETYSKAEIESWTENSSHNIENRIYLIQTKFGTDTIKGIIREITTMMKSKVNPHTSVSMSR